MVERYSIESWMNRKTCQHLYAARLQNSGNEPIVRTTRTSYVEFALGLEESELTGDSTGTRTVGEAKRRKATPPSTVERVSRWFNRPIKSLVPAN